MKHILAIIITVCVAFSVTGCTLLTGGDKESVTDYALHVLEERYGEPFEYKAPAGSSYSGTKTFLATCQSFGDKSILVQITNFKDAETRVVQDNYLAVKYRDELNNRVASIVANTFGAARLTTCNSTGRTLPTGLLPTSTFEDYLKGNESLISCAVVFPGSAFADNAQFYALAKELVAAIPSGELSFIIGGIPDDEYAVITDEDFRNRCLIGNVTGKAVLARRDNKSEPTLRLLEETGENIYSLEGVLLEYTDPSTGLLVKVGA